MMKKLLIIIILSFSLSEVSSQAWSEDQKIAASDRGQNDQFGWSVSMDGNIIAVGAHLESHDSLGTNTLTQSGSVYLFEKNQQGDWEEVQKLVANDRATNSYFGVVVDIDDNNVVIGARGERKNVMGGDTLLGAGAVYIFKKNENNKWIQFQKIVSSDRELKDSFGSSVSIDSNYLIIGAPRESEDFNGQNHMPQAGSAYIFEKDSMGYWIETQKITPSDRSPYEQFGVPVGIDGNYAAVGVHMKTDSLGGTPVYSAGAVYIFKRDSTGAWTEIQKLSASDKAESDYFGSSVSIQGKNMVIGASGEDNIPGGDDVNNDGAVYFFEKSNTGQWEETQKVVASDGGALAQFGYSVSIDGDGVVIGAPGEMNDSEGNNFTWRAGAAYLFEKNASGTWKEVQKVSAPNRSSWDYFGNSVAISGSTVIVGAFYEDEDSVDLNPLENAGSAYIFERSWALGTNEPVFSLPIQTYPNPTTGKITLELESILPEINITVRNLIGQIVLNKTTKNSRQITLDLDGPAGMYLIEIEAVGGESKIIKVMKE